MYTELKNTFALPQIELADYSPLTLAYIGDCVYELVIRTNIVCEANAPVNKLNKRGSDLAKAGTQSAMIDALLAAKYLSEEEEAAYRRGRNANSHSKAKNASLSEYRRATGFEAMLGYLYLSEQHQRVMDLIAKGWELIGE